MINGHKKKTDSGRRGAFGIALNREIFYTCVVPPNTAGAAKLEYAVIATLELLAAVVGTYIPIMFVVLNWKIISRPSRK